jgi:HlyD family secretion protein
MSSGLKKWFVPGAAALSLAIALTYAFWPQAIPADLGTVKTGPLQVTIDDEGETRVRDIYVVSAPLAGRMLRLQGRVGDQVVAGETVVATIQPTVPTFHDIRTHSELEAVVRAAEAARDLARAELARLKAARDFAAAEYKRAAALAKKGTVSQSALDRAEMEARTQDAAMQIARAGLKVRVYQLANAQAAIADPGQKGRNTDSDAHPDKTCCFEVFAPVSGTILRLIQESEAVVAAGASLIEIGDPSDMEIAVDLLSSDAVQVSPGDAVMIESWGGSKSLRGEVVRVEPFGFTKVSALGIEEQRVNVIIRFTDPPEAWARLGHGYRVETRIVMWRADDVVQVPLSSLFRDRAGKWSVFRVANGRAILTTVQINHMSAVAAEITAGLEPDEVIVLHPSGRIEDGIMITAR